MYGANSEKYAHILEPTLHPMVDEIIRMGKLKGGQRVMDLATGTGLIARKILSSSNSVIGVDISLEALKTAQKMSMGQIPFVAADAHVLPFADCCLDLVTCGLGLSHFLRVSIALSEVFRILNSDGHFLASAWSKEKKDPLFPTALETLGKHAGNTENYIEELIDEDLWGDKKCGCELLRNAGFEDVRVRTHPLSAMFRSPTEAAEWALAWPSIRVRLDQLAPTIQERIRTELISLVADAHDVSWHSEVIYYQARKSVA